MYAVVKTGGKQYRVKEGDTLRVEKLEGDKGSMVELKDVLAIGEGEAVKLGAPAVDNAKVLCEILLQGKDKKVLLFKKKRRKGYSKKQGHRQFFTSIKIKEIKA
ncbi:MAG TPA: 50S ribosomal protein L21 [Thermodesulfobacteriota bacterium]|nr:50S ribosomal protein L21 [Thermodesulfobacteriota bacterium]